MIKLLKRFWAFLFGTKAIVPEKSITEKAIDLLQEQKMKHGTDRPVQVDLSEKKPFSIFKKKLQDLRMRNNRLLIQYNGESKFAGRNVFFHGRWSHGAMYKHRTDSMRCTKLKRAEQIVGQIEKYCIERAVFKDAGGNEFKLI